MSIERLNMAATAAGYAMATPDDDAVVEAQSETKTLALPSRAVVVAEQKPRLGASETVNGITGWVKGYWSGFGWRMPA